LSMRIRQQKENRPTDRTVESEDPEKAMKPHLGDYKLKTLYYY